MGVPPNEWFIAETPIKLDDSGVTPFQETSLYCIVMYCIFLKLFAGCKYKQSYIVTPHRRESLLGKPFLGESEQSLHRISSTVRMNILLRSRCRPCLQSGPPQPPNDSQVR